MKKVKVGQKIWAIDPCETFGGQHTLTVGKSYVIEDADDFTIVFIDDLRKSHPMAKINASRYFSLTPPKEVKEGVSVIINLDLTDTEVMKIVNVVRVLTQDKTNFDNFQVTCGNLILVGQSGIDWLIDKMDKAYCESFLTLNP